jgi:hypothetical protein
VHQLIIADNALCDSKIPRVPGRYPLAGHDVDPTLNRPERLYGRLREA